MKQVYHNIKKCCVSLYWVVNQDMFVRLQITYLSTAGIYLVDKNLKNVDEILDEIADFWRPNKTFWITYSISTGDAASTKGTKRPMQVPVQSTACISAWCRNSSGSHAPVLNTTVYNWDVFPTFKIQCIGKHCNIQYTVTPIPINSNTYCMLTRQVYRTSLRRLLKDVTCCSDT